MNWILLIGCFALWFGFYPLRQGFELFTLQHILGLGISTLGVFMILWEVKAK